MFSIPFAQESRSNYKAIAFDVHVAISSFYSVLTLEELKRVTLKNPNE
jgi:hypothetical protein